MSALRSPNATLSEEFTVIGSVRELEDGRVLVTDEKENRIIVGDFRSGEIRTLGRRGGGPGEYTQVGRLWAMGQDSTLMADRFAQRWLIFEGSRIVATLPPDAPAVRGTSRGMLQGVDQHGGVVANAQSLNQSSPRSARDSMLVVRFDRGSGRLDTVAMVSSEPLGGPVGGGTKTARVGGRPSQKQIYEVSIISPDQVAVFPDGWIAVARVNPYRIDWCAPGGKCMIGPLLLGHAQPMTDRDKRVYLQLAAQTTRWPPTSELDETAGWPDIVPPFVVPPRRLDAGALVPCPDGRLLIQRLETTDPVHTHYDVIDRRGSFVAKIALPVNQQIVGFGINSVYVAVIDDDGIQRLARHPWP